MAWHCKRYMEMKNHECVRSLPRPWSSRVPSHMRRRCLLAKSGQTFASPASKHYHGISCRISNLPNREWPVLVRIAALLLNLLIVTGKASQAFLKPACRAHTGKSLQLDRRNVLTTQLLLASRKVPLACKLRFRPNSVLFQLACEPSKSRDVL